MAPGRQLGVVSAATTEAAAAGVEILELGGNAFDAAVAVALALGVTEPAGSGLGGQAIWLVKPAGGEPLVIDGSSRAPRSMPDVVTASDLVGVRASTVPSTLLVLEAAFERFGSRRVSWEQLFAPAIRWAEEGYRPGPFRRAAILRYATELRRDPAGAEIFLGSDGGPRELERHSTLAKTLRRLARYGAEDFYHGEIAETVAADIRRRGGWITRRDLADARIEMRPAVRGRYRDLDVYSVPPPAAGWVVLRALHLLDSWPSTTLHTQSPDRIVWLGEALADAHATRGRLPISSSGDLEAALEMRLGRDAVAGASNEIESPSGETTHFSVADRAGNVVSASLSLNAYFGTRVLSPGLGFLYNDYMREFVLDDPHHPYALRSGARPYSSMSATILERKGRPQLALGSPGSRRIISAVVQTVSRWVDAGQPLQTAVSGTRIHVVPEHSTLMLEERPENARITAALERRGFRIRVPVSSLGRGGLDPYFGGIHAVAWEGGTWVGAADPRRDGAVHEARTRSQTD
jgi:gamma-glutamyltranspeptidase/glutathione hydrolase